MPVIDTKQGAEGEQMFPISLIRGFSPCGTERVPLSSLVKLAGARRWSHISWGPDADGRVKRRKALFAGSSLIVVDLDAPKDGPPIDLDRVLSLIGEHRLRGFLLNGRRLGNYTLVIVPERPMTTEPMHRATHLHWCGVFGGDRAVCDAVDFLKARRKRGNPLSGRVLWSDLTAGVPAVVLNYVSPVCREPPAGIRKRGQEGVSEVSPSKHTGTSQDTGSTVPNSVSLRETHTRYGIRKPGQEETVAEIESWLSRRPPAVSGRGGNARLFNTMMNLGRVLHASGRLGLLGDLIKRCYNPRCMPPWPDSDIDRQVRNVERYATGWDPAEAGGLSEHNRCTAKFETYHCACGCGVQVDQVGGRGRVKRYATSACAKRTQRRKANRNEGIRGEDHAGGRSPTSVGTTMVAVDTGHGGVSGVTGTPPGADRDPAEAQVHGGPDGVDPLHRDVRQDDGRRLGHRDGGPGDHREVCDHEHPGAVTSGADDAGIRHDGRQPPPEQGAGHPGRGAVGGGPGGGTRLHAGAGGLRQEGWGAVGGLRDPDQGGTHTGGLPGQGRLQGLPHRPRPGAFPPGLLLDQSDPVVRRLLELSGAGDGP